jgi:hypothetical protein
MGGQGILTRPVCHRIPLVIIILCRWGSTQNKTGTRRLNFTAHGQAQLGLSNVLDGVRAEPAPRQQNPQQSGQKAVRIQTGRRHPFRFVYAVLGFALRGS